MEVEPSRKLAVILHADVVGSTALVHADETLAHQRIRDTFQHLSEIIRGKGGIAHEIRGDALVAEFSRGSDAVEAALSFQADNSARIEALSDDIAPIVRVGIAMGEILVADNTMTGEGVILAQRLEQLAEPGGVCIQDAVYQTVPKRLPIHYENLGERQLKGFDEPVRVFAVTQKSEADRASTVTPAAHALHPSDKPSIVVLPFKNMSTDPEQEFFADGMGEDIIIALSQLSAISVVAHDLSFSYKGRSVKVKDIARDLGVRYLLEGSVRKSGERARITAQLIDSRDGKHLWAERYDRKLEDVFEVQDEITRNVAIALQVKLSAGEHARIWQSGTRSFEAWQYQVRGVQGFYKFTSEGRKEAREAFEKAVSIDPEFLSAWAALGHTLYQSARFHDFSDITPLLERAGQISAQLLSFEEGRASGYAIQANLRHLEGDHEQAIAAARRAVELEPDSPDHRGRLANILVYCGEPAEALKQFNNAVQSSPHYPNWFTNVPVLGYYLLGNMESARQSAEEALARFPEYPYAYVNLAGIYGALGRTADARALVVNVLRLQPAFSLADYAKSQLFANPADADRWIGDLRKAGLPD